MTVASDVHILDRYRDLDGKKFTILLINRTSGKVFVRYPLVREKDRYAVITLEELARMKRIG